MDLTENNPTDRGLTQLIERLDAFEERAGVRLDALYAKVDGSSGWETADGHFIPGVRVNGELHPREGTSLKEAISVVADAYDSAGRLVGSASARFFPKTFFGYESFSILTGGIPPRQISKIRVYPKLGL